MARRKKNSEAMLGVPIEAARANRDRIAAQDGGDYGADLIFPELIAALLDEVPEGVRILEVGAATGVLTRELVPRAAMVTALEISEGMLATLMSRDVADSPHLRVMQGVVEELPREIAFELAVVTFTPRRGQALSTLLPELALRVHDRIVVVFADDRTLDWAYLARASCNLGLDTRLRMVRGSGEHRGVILTATVADWEPLAMDHEDWAIDAREIEVPYPAPRGTAARLVRYFLSVGDRALLVKTDERGLERLYGNLRTAAHRLGQGEVTVRMHEDAIQVVRLPKATEAAPGE
jgi:SAM-dependent methyltransferase